MYELTTVLKLGVGFDSREHSIQAVVHVAKHFQIFIQPFPAHGFPPFAFSPISTKSPIAPAVSFPYAWREAKGCVMELSDADQVTMSEYLNSVLDAYKAGKIEREKARRDLTRAIMAAVEGNETEFKAYIRQPFDQRGHS
jgi:hypothetical protein